MGLVRHLTLKRRQQLPPIEPAEVCGTSFDIITSGSGVFVRATHPDFDVLMPHLPGDIRGLEPLTPALDLKVPRIPAVLLERVFADANRAENDRGQRVESLFYFRFDRSDGLWELVSPSQVATPGSVTPTDTGPSSPFESALVELHSHHDLSLGARFSARDNKDECTRLRLFAVIGHTSTAPELRLRCGVFGHFYEVNAEQLFELPAGVSDALHLDETLRHETTGRLTARPRGLDLFSVIISNLPALAAASPLESEEDEEGEGVGAGARPAFVAGRTLGRERANA